MKFPTVTDGLKVREHCWVPVIESADQLLITSIILQADINLLRTCHSTNNPRMPKRSRDCDFPHGLEEELNCLGITENAILPLDQLETNFKPTTLIDECLELIDPTPNVHTLFIQFNKRFFRNILEPVEVKWSNRMTSCAGTCSFHPRNRQCIITLSAPLLKLRPRKDLVETLLHEMIHGFLFLTNNNRDRDGHGPEFCNHMNRINKAAGTNITIYHSFRDEVRVYQQHWWKCNGPCQNTRPFFGMVRRAMNRAPGPSDFWWKQHQQNCGGVFIKIKEPENFKSKVKKNNESEVGKRKTGQRNVPSTNTSDISKWLTGGSSSPSYSSSSNVFKKLGNATTNVHGSGTGGPNRSASNSSGSSSILIGGTVAAIKSATKITTDNPSSQNSSNTYKKLGNTTNNVHGWGTGGPNGLNRSPSNSSGPGSRFVGSAIALGGSNSGQSNLLAKFETASSKAGRTSSKIKTLPIQSIDSCVNKSKSKAEGDESAVWTIIDELVECPLCFEFFSANVANQHANDCCGNVTRGQNNKEMRMKGECEAPPVAVLDSTLVSQEERSMASCPLCAKFVQLTRINQHLDECLVSDAEL